MSLLKERGVVVEKGRQCQSKEAFSGERKSTWAELSVVRRSVSVNVTDALLNPSLMTLECQDADHPRGAPCLEETTAKGHSLTVGTHGVYQ